MNTRWGIFFRNKETPLLASMDDRPGDAYLVAEFDNYMDADDALARASVMGLRRFKKWHRETKLSNH